MSNKKMIVRGVGSYLYPRQLDTLIQGPTHGLSSHDKMHCCPYIPFLTSAELLQVGLSLSDQTTSVSP